MSTVLVTGAAGFIGLYLSLRLLNRGDEVFGLDNMNSYYNPSLKEARLQMLTGHSGFKFVRLDAADRRAMEDLFASERFDIVVHLGAQAGVRYSLQNPAPYIDSNLA